MKKVVVTILQCWLLITIQAQKQGQERIDSLLQRLPRIGTDSNKVKLLNELSYLYSDVNPSEGIKYGQQALLISVNLDWRKGMADANNRLGMNYYTKTDYPN